MAQDDEPRSASSNTPAASPIEQRTLDQPSNDGPIASSSTLQQLTPVEHERMMRIWTKNLKFPDGAQPEIIRADQKDSYFIDVLQDQLEPLVRAVKGARWVSTHSDRLQEASQFLYLGLTTLPGSQTLGEEYCDIIQFDSFTGNVPTLFRRAIFIFIQVFSPRLFARLYRSLRDSFATAEDLRSQDPEHLGPLQAKLARLKHSLCGLLRSLPANFDRTASDTLNLLHITVFYLTGKYYTFSKRFSGIRYSSNRLRPLRPDGQGRVSPPSYEVLGLLMSVQLLVRLAVSWKALYRRREQLGLFSPPSPEPAVDSKGKGKQTSAANETPTVDGRPIDEIILEDEEDDKEAQLDQSAGEEETIEEDCPEGVTIDKSSSDMTSRRCTLCLGPRRHPSSLECGHVFCWRCVVSWVKEKPECPLCRHSVQVADLLPLCNF